MNLRRAFRPLVVAAAAGLLAWHYWSEPSASPGTLACAFRIGDAQTPAVNYVELPAETPFRIALTSDQPRHVYVVSHNFVDGTILLWPAPGLRSDCAQPLAGRVLLPGSINAQSLAWTTRSETSGPTTVLVLASRSPLTELEAVLQRLRHWTNSVLTDNSMLVTMPTAADALLGKPQDNEWPHDLLRQAAAQTILSDLPSGPLLELPGTGVWVAGWRFREQPGSAKSPLPRK